MSVIEWLESPEGEKWSSENHSHVSILLACIKEDTFVCAWRPIWVG